MEKFEAHWDKLRIFCQVAKVGSLNAASEVLNTSQPALSRSIGILEEHLGVSLFERLPTGLCLTRQGEILFEATEKMVKELSQTQVSLEEEESEPVGSIRIGSTTGFASLYLSNIMPEFLKRYPKIQLSISGSDVLPNLHSDEADAIVSPFISDDDSLIQSHLTTFHLRLYASPEYLAEFGAPQSVEDLDHHRLLAYGDHQTVHPFGTANWHLTVGREKGNPRAPYCMINSALGLSNMASHGVGIVSLSQEHPPIRAANLVEVLPQLEGPAIEGYFIYSSRTRKVKRVKLLKEFLLKKFSNELKSKEGKIAVNCK